VQTGGSIVAAVRTRTRTRTRMGTIQNQLIQARGEFGFGGPGRFARGSGRRLGFLQRTLRSRNGDCFHWETMIRGCSDAIATMVAGARSHARSDVAIGIGTGIDIGIGIVVGIGASDPGCCCRTALDSPTVSASVASSLLPTNIRGLDGHAGTSLLVSSLVVRTVS